MPRATAKERRPSAAIFAAGKPFLSSPLNQKTSSRKGGRIRGAAEQGERKRVGSLILMGFYRYHHHCGDAPSVH